MILRWLISAVGLAAFKSEASAIMQRASRRALLVALVILLWLTAFGFALAALSTWLTTELGSIAAYAIIAGSLAVIGFAIQLAIAISARRQPRLNVPFASLNSNSDARLDTERSNLGSMAIVAVVGYLLGRQIVRR